MLPSSRYISVPGVPEHTDVDATVCTWRDMAGQWLRAPNAGESELEALARRLAAVQRWRGVPRPGAPRT